MENSKKRSLREEIEKDVQHIEKEIASHPELDQIHVTKEMDEALMSKIREYEKKRAEEEAVCRDRTEKFEEKKRKGNVSDMEVSEELVPDIRTISKVYSVPDAQVVSEEDLVSGGGAASEAYSIPEAGRTVTVKYRKRRIRWIAALAAVLVLALGLGMTSVVSKSYWKELLDVLMGAESARIIDVEDMEKKDTEDIDEMQVYKEISEIFGQTPVWMRYKPEGMFIKEYEIDEDLQLARLFFEYNDAVIRYSVYASQDDSSWTGKEEDEIVATYKVEVDGNEIEVKELKKPKQTESRCIANFEYNGIHYELKGVLEKEELEKILENLYFL